MLISLPKGCKEAAASQAKDITKVEGRSVRRSRLEVVEGASEMLLQTPAEKHAVA
jgi:hypothetical protein